MAFTTLLAIEQVAASQNNKEVTINDAVLALENATQASLSVDLTSADVVLTAAQFTRSVSFRCSGHSVSRVLTVPLTKRLFSVANLGTGAIAVGGTTGSTVSVAQGRRRLLYCTGADVEEIGPSDGELLVASLTDGPGAPGSAVPGQAVRVNAGATALEYANRTFEASLTVTGKPEAGEVLLRHEFAAPTEFAAGLAGWRFRAASAATGATVLTVKLEGVSVGTVTIAASGTTATFAAASAVLGTAGQLLTIEAPSPADATLGDFGLTLFGIRK